jgi:chaperonin cofactor prefoldin
VEDRISGIKHKINTKEKTEESIDKRLKSCKQNTQEISDSTKDQTCKS